MKILAAIALLLAAASPVSASPTIAINQSPVALGDFVTFTVTGVSKHIKNPRIEVDAFQATCAPDYTCLPGPNGSVETFGMDGSTSYAFQLGGAGSAWLAQGGPADCVAILFYFDNSGPTQQYVELARVTFSAGG
jgi:hypothetical protein